MKALRDPNMHRALSAYRATRAIAPVFASGAPRRWCRSLGNSEPPAQQRALSPIAGNLSERRPPISASGFVCRASGAHVPHVRSAPVHSRTACAPQPWAADVALRGLRPASWTPSTPGLAKLRQKPSLTGGLRVFGSRFCGAHCVLPCCCATTVAAAIHCIDMVTSAVPLL